MKKILIFAVSAYVVCYAMYRHYSTMEHEGAQYVVFPAETPAYYYAFLPIATLDGLITGRKPQFGPFET